MNEFSKRPPAEQQRVPIGILRVRPRRPIKVVHLSTWFYGMMTHYVNNRTVYCPGPESCPYCSSQGALWKGHSVVREFDSEKIALLQITPYAYSCLEPAFGKRESIAGLVALYFRKGQEKNSQLMAQTHGYVSVGRTFSFDQTAEFVKRIFKENVDHTLLVNFRNVESV